MAMERRIFQRHPLAMDGLLYLCRGVNGDRLSRPVKCSITDLSRKGAGLITPQIIVDNHHLFFAALESDQHILHLEIEAGDDNTAPITIPVRPLWFDRLLHDDQKPFKIGIAFFAKISEENYQFIKSRSR